MNNDNTTYTPVPSLRDFYLSVACPRCKAEPYEPCTVKSPKGREFHLPRQDKGIRKHQKATTYVFPEDRVNGQRYDDLDPRKVEVWEVRKWVWHPEHKYTCLETSITEVNGYEIDWTDHTMTRMVIPES